MITVDKTKNKEFKKSADNPKRLAEYLLFGLGGKTNEKQRVLCKGTFNCFTDDIVSASEMIKLLNERYNATASGRSKNKLRTHHIIISLNAGEHLSAEQWYDVAYQHLKTLNLEDHLALWAVHKDTDNEHMHLVFSDVNPKTIKINNLSNERRKFQKLDVKLEEKYLIKKDNHVLTHFGNESLALDYEAKTAQQSLFSYIYDIKPELDQALTWNQFFNTLNKNGIRCEKYGRGIIFKTEDPFNSEKSIYVKGSAFGNLSLSSLEKRLGKFDNSFKYSEKQVIRKYNATPVNFDIENKNENEKDFFELLNNAYSDFEKFNKQNQTNNKELEKRLKILNYEYKTLLKEERRKYKNQITLIKKSYQLQEDELQKQLIIALSEYKKKKEYLEKRKKEIVNKLKIIFSSQYNAANFLEFLKKGVLLGVKRDRNLLLLLSRKDSQKQNHKNYIIGPRVRIVKADSVADTMMYIKNEKLEKNFYIHKVTGKGQIILNGKNKIIGDFIKDDGKKIICNDNPSPITVKTIAAICQQTFEKNRSLTCHGSPDFQRMVLEFTLRKDFDLTFYNNEVLNKEYDRRRKEYKSCESERKQRREFTKFRDGQRDKSIRKTNRFTRTKSNRNSISRFRIIESARIDEGNSRATETSKQQQYISTNRDFLSNIEYFNDTGRNQQNNAQSKGSLHNMSKLSVATEQQRSSMLLSDDKRDSVGISTQREVLPRMRWQIPDERSRGINEENKREINESVLDILNKFDSINDKTNSQKNLNQEKANQKEEPQEIDFVQEYINERNEKHNRGFKDVLYHEIYSDQKGEFVFKGLREISLGNYYALLEQKNKIYIKKVENYALSRLKKSKRGSIVKIDNSGRIINTNRKY